MIHEDKSFKVNDFKSFVVTGRLYMSNKRFKLEYTSHIQVMNINLWNGSIWGVLKSNGKRKLLKRVCN